METHLRTIQRTLALHLAAIALLLVVPAFADDEPDEPAASPAEAEGEEELPTNEECEICHASKDQTKKLPSGELKSLFVPEESLKGSVHEGKPCVSCHAGVKEVPHPKGEAIPAATCVPCHDDPVEENQNGVHGPRDGKPGNGCASCHGSPHEMVPLDDPKSPTHRTQVPLTCGRCHGALGMVVEKRTGILQRPFLEYQQSVHGKAVANGSGQAAVCTDCHGAHDIQPPSNSSSLVSKFSVPETCGQCHEKVKAAYEQSVHGQALRLGVTRAPSCTDCHGIHTIRRTVDPSSSVSQQLIATTTCAQCHASVILSREFGLQANRLQSYLESYHGLASTRGSKVVANCASCHGIHEILPESDPRSMIHPANLPQTCGTCHPGAGTNFTAGSVHGIAVDTLGAKILAFVRQFYLALIVLTVGVMFGHNLIDLLRKIDPSRRILPPARLASPRLDRQQRVQHALLAVSFIALALSGFALAYPSSWVSFLFGPGESVRRWVHRGAAIVMTLVGMYHLFYLAATRSGRKAFGQMLPRISDFREAVHTVSYNLGMREKRPEPAHFDYAEKIEYWALIWGTIIMTVTGAILWFKIWATEGLGLPLWGLDVALAVHYYEAILATLAIIIWHFYFVIFDPAVYPMNWAWLTGWIRLKRGE